LPYYRTPSGNRVYFQSYGKTGPAVVLLHGLGSSGRIWLRQVRALRQNFSVFVLDLPGHGRSDWWGNYTFNGFADLLNDWMDFCEIDQAHLVALSLGCTVALTLAVRYPDRVKSLILEGPLAACSPWWNPLGWLDKPAFRLLPIILALVIRVMGRQATTHWINTYGIKGVRSFKNLEADQALVDFRVVQQLLQESAAPPYLGCLHTVDVPALLIRGAHDPFPNRFSAYIQAHMPTVTRITIANTRHIVAMEAPTVFNRLMLSFLSAPPLLAGNFGLKHPEGL